MFPFIFRRLTAYQLIQVSGSVISRGRVQFFFVFVLTSSNHGSFCNPCGHNLLVRKHKDVLLNSTYMPVFTEIIFGLHMYPVMCFSY